MLKTALAFLFILGLACGCAAPGAKRVARTYELPAVGSKAPDFWMKNQEQVRVSLSDFTGKKNVILVFFPLAFTPVWTGELGEYRESYSLLRELDTEVFGVSVDSWATLKKYREELNLPFDLLSDWDREASKKYGTFNEREGVANRKSFLIDRKGMVRFIQESGLEEPRKHEDMLAAVKKLRQRGQPGPAAAGEAAGPVDAVFYEFYSETCEHCKKMKPVVEEFRKKHEKRFGKFLLIPFKGSGNISLFHEYNITGTPTFIITDAAGKEIDRISGVVSLEALVTFMENSFRRMRKR